jgi:hypothetical protein
MNVATKVSPEEEEEEEELLSDSGNSDLILTCFEEEFSSSKSFLKSKVSRDAVLLLSGGKKQAVQFPFVVPRFPLLHPLSG